MYRVDFIELEKDIVYRIAVVGKLRITGWVACGKLYNKSRI